jgi:hypothetical protein
MMNKLFTAAHGQPKAGGNFLDLPGTRVWWDEPISDSRRPARVGWLPGTARYAALAAFVVAGGAMLATYRRSMNHNT